MYYMYLATKFIVRELSSYSTATKTTAKIAVIILNSIKYFFGIVLDLICRA